MRDTSSTLEGEMDRRFRRYAGMFIAIFVGVIATLFAVLVLIDPYDTGRFPTFMPGGVTDESSRTGNASRGRNPVFDAAVLGNSRAMLLDPKNLSTLTGFKFLQFTSPGSGPREAMILLRYFLKFHTRVSAIVLSVDERWCTHQDPLPVYFPFPFWLYGSDLDYLANLFNTRSVTAARDRVMLALGRAALYDPAGFFDYETGRPWTFHPAAPERAHVDPPQGPASVFFPALDQLDGALKELPAGTPVVLLMSPIFHLMLPPVGSVAEAELRECKARLVQVANGRRFTSVLDYLTDSPLSRDPENFMDIEHFRLRVSRRIEADIADRLKSSYAEGR